MLQAAQACHSCRDRKKRCDRALPGCSDCQRRQVQCQYSQKVEERGMVESLEQKLMSLERSIRDAENAFIDQQEQQLFPVSRLERGIQYEVSYPVSKRWYFPMLLHFRFHSMVPATKNLSSESAAYKLRTAWVNGYLNNPAMFHGVMYAASANLDLINGEHDNPVTNFHRAEAIRLVQRTISFLEPHDELPLAVLAATWALAHVARLNGSTSEAQLHEVGLAQMIRCKGQNADLGFDGALSFLIMLSDIWNAVINEQDATIDFINELQPPYIAQPRRTLLSNALRYTPNEGLLSKDIILLLHMINDSRSGVYTDDTITLIEDPLCQPSSSQSSMGKPPSDLTYILMPLLQAEMLASVQRQDYISECCCLAAMIYCQVLFTSLPFLSPGNESIANQLFVTLQHCDGEQWMNKAPDLHLWVCYVGALASRNRVQRVSFLARSKTSVVILTSDRTLGFQDGVSHLLCLSRYVKQRQHIF
ncbi:hypothetical protein EYB25_008119 [Talaromyces marneffei]|nr:hypothetical protein EYB25_008119 [Talaromyces marneffei]